MPSFAQRVIANPARYTYEELKTVLTETVPPLIPRVVEAARDFACGIYQNTPAGFLDRIETAAGFINPQHVLMDGICRPINKLPPAPQPQINGGQCECVMYAVSGDTYFEGAYTDSFSTNHPGPIRNVGISSDGTDIGFDYGATACPGGRFKVIQGGAPELRAKRFEIRNWAVTRVDGQPDNCGSIVPTYPPNYPSPSDLTRTSPFQITPTLSAPITVTVNPTISFDPTVLAPVLSVNLGGLNVNFDLGGVTISPDFSNSTNTTNNFPTTTNPTPTPTPVKNPSDSIDNATDFSAIVQLINELKKEVEDCCERDRPYPPPDANKVITTLLDTANSGLYDLPANTFQIAVRIVTQPQKVKTQAGILAPKVLYAGWAWFGAANNMSERMPMDSEFKLYSPPRYISNTFGFTLYQGLTATITAYSIKPKTPTP